MAASTVLPGALRLTRQDVGIDDRRSPVLEEIDNGRFFPTQCCR
jgi:hypothetical protein